MTLVRSKSVMSGNSASLAASTEQQTECVLVGDELKDVMTREEVEALVKRKTEALESSIQAKAEAAAEAMVMAILQRDQDKAYRGSAREAEVPDEDHDNLELVQLVNGAKIPGETTTKEEHPGLSEEEEEWHTPFGETVYTLLYMGSITNSSFWYGLFIYAIQMATILLTLVDIIEPESKTNPLQIPAMVGPAVTYSQAISLFMALAYQSDLIEGVLKLHHGFYPDLMEKYPWATFHKWLASCLAQLCAGLLLMVACFILTMQVRTVIDVMLNLTALLFMAEIDDLGFAIAKMGFFTRNLEREVRSTIDIQVPRQQGKKFSRRLIYTTILFSLMAGYGILKKRQLDGHYLPTFIYVQFGDAYNPKIPYYSGIMTSGNVRTSGYRVYHDVDTERILLAYCPSEESWTFSETGDPCDYFARSHPTRSYDVTTIPDSEWLIKDSIDRLQPFDSFSLVNRDCTPETCQGTCGADGLCLCPHDKFGMDCEFTDVCPRLSISDQYPPFPTVTLPSVFHAGGLFGVSTSFQLLQNDDTKEYVKVYNMPVYYSNKTYPANIIFFGGRRWILTTEWDLSNNSTNIQANNPDKWFFQEETVATLEEKFHAHYLAKYTPLFVSDAVDFETPDFKPTPAGLKWWTAKETNKTSRHYVLELPVDTELICNFPCSGQPEDFCGDFGFCDEYTDACLCLEAFGYHGNRCELQIPCYDTGAFEETCNGNGFCEESSGFCRCNKPYFGKLCEAHYKCFEEDGVCKNGSTCNTTTGECTCPEDPGISGVACEQIASCHVFGCANGGLCAVHPACVCRPPFYGIHCDLVNATQEDMLCVADQDCMDGHCHAETGICECEDKSRYGALCEYSYNCSESVATLGGVACLNKGTCNNSTGVCDCPKPFYGPDCSQVPDCLNDADCGDGEEDWCNLESGQCECSKGFAAGKMCEIDPSTACFHDEDCRNGGVCSFLPGLDEGECECRNGFTGSFCEFWVAGEYDPAIDLFQVYVQFAFDICGFENETCVDEFWGV